MKVTPAYLLLFFLSLLLCQCHHTGKTTVPETDEETERRNEEMARESEKAWAEAKQYRETVTDTDFLQTRQPMSDDAIAPYDYHTGMVGDKAYNQTVYILAFERARKHLSLEQDTLRLNLHAGADIHIAEDLYEYIVWVFGTWNEWVREGRFRIIQGEDGYYDLASNKDF